MSCPEAHAVAALKHPGSRTPGPGCGPTLCHRRYLLPQLGCRAPFHLHASLRRRGARPAQDFLYAQQGRGQRAGGRDRPATRREGSAYGDAKAWQARSRATSVTEITGPRCLVAWEAGRLCRPRTVAGGFGNPLRVPMSTTACRRQKRPNHDTRIRLASQKTDLIAQRTRHHPTTMLACSLQGPGV